MEKNISKRVVAGTLALLTVFGSAPATLQGVFAPTQLVAGAVDANQVAGKVEYSNAKRYIESVKVGTITYTSDMVAENTSFSAAAGKIVTVTSKVPLTLTKGDSLKYTRKTGTVFSAAYYPIINNLYEYSAEGGSFLSENEYTFEEMEAILNSTADISAFNTTHNVFRIASFEESGATKYTADYDFDVTLPTGYTDLGAYVVNGTKEANAANQISGLFTSGSVVMSDDDFNAASLAVCKKNYFTEHLTTDYDSGAAMTKAADTVADADLTANQYKLSTTGGKYVYTYKATEAGVSIDTVKKSVTEAAAAGTTQGVFTYKDVTVNANVTKDTLTVGSTVKISCTKPFTLKTTPTGGTATEKKSELDESGAFVVQFVVGEDNYTVTSRDIVKDFTYTVDGNTVLANSKTTPKDVVNGVAAKISASYHETLTGKEWKALTAAQRALYAPNPDGTGEFAVVPADDALVYKKAATAIDNNGTIPFGTAGVSATVTVNENLLGKSAANGDGNSAIYSVAIKLPGDAQAKTVIFGRDTGGDGVEIQDDFKTETNPDGILTNENGFAIEDITEAGTYEATITVWPTTTTEAAKTATYKFTIGTSDEISEEDITLTADGDSKLASDTTKNSSACKKGETVEFTTYKTAGVATPVHVTPTLAAKFDLTEGEDYYFTGADTATEAGTVNTLTLNIVSGNYGGSATNPVQIPVKWTLVDPEAADDFTFTANLNIDYYDVAEDKTRTARAAEDIAADIKKSLGGKSGKVNFDEITFSYEPVDANGEEDLDREDQGGAGLPSSIGYWKVTANWKDTVIKSAMFQIKDNDGNVVKVTAVPANADELEVVFGDTLDISAWKFYVDYRGAENPGTEVTVDFMEDTNIKFSMAAQGTFGEDGYIAAQDGKTADELNLGGVGKKDVTLIATDKRAAQAVLPGTNELESTTYEIQASTFKVEVVPKDLSTAVLADIIVSKGEQTVVKIREYLKDTDFNDKNGNTAYEATDKATGATFELEVVSGVTIASKVGDYDVEFKAKSANYTGTIKTKWHVVENAAGYTLNVTGGLKGEAGSEVYTADAELSGLNKVKVEATRTTAGTLTSSTEFGILYGTADDAAAAKEALIYEGAGTTCEVVAGDGIAKTVADKDAKAKFELTVADPDNTWVVAYAKDEGGTYVYSEPAKVDINGEYAKKVTAENLKMDTPVYIDDNGTIKAYAFVERPKIEVGDAGKKTEITPVEWGVVVSREGKYYDAKHPEIDVANNYKDLVLGAADTVKGTSKGATGAYTAYNYGVKVKVTNQYADMVFKPYCKFADGSVFYGTAKKIVNLNDKVTDAVALNTAIVANAEKAKMRVTRKVTGTYIAGVANTNAEFDAEKLTYTKTTQAAEGTNPAVTTTLKLVDLSNASGFGVVVDKSGASAIEDDKTTTDVNELDVTKNTLVVGNKTYTTGASKTPNVSSITETIGDKHYVIGQLTDKYAAYGAATVPTNTTTKKVVFRGYVTYGTMSFYTNPTTCTLTAPAQGGGTGTGTGV